MYFFFFQAEDGIRDLTVTGVQTCALPICFRKIVGGAWSVFFPRSEFSLVTDASAQFWMACLYSSRTDEMVNGFVGLFLMPHRDRLQALNRGYVKQRGPHLPDAIPEYLDKS